MKRILMPVALSVLLIINMIFILPIGRATVKAEENTYWVATNGSDSNPGTQLQPFRTIQKAVDTARAGDTIIIKSGTYNESIVLKYSGTKTSPITIMAENRHGVTISSTGTIIWANNWEDTAYSGPTRYISFKGIIFSGSTQDRGLFVSRGTCFEDCIFRGGGVAAKGGDAKYIRCIFEDNTYSGISAGYNDYLFKDCIIRRANQSMTDPGYYEGACKVTYTTGLVVDGLISYDNYGAGWWCDWDHRNFIIKNSTIFGNHAGEGWRASTNSIENSTGEAIGIFIEGSPGPGLIENNVIYSCDEGIRIGESGFSNKIIIRNNKIYDCDYGINIRGMNRNNPSVEMDSIYDVHKAGAADIYSNIIKDWGIRGWCSTADASITADTPGAMNINFDNNSFDYYINTSMASWKYNGNEVICSSIAEIRSNLNAEFNGWEGALSEPDTYIETTPLTYDKRYTDEMHQVNLALEEANTIDSAIGSNGVGSIVTIPVYGRRPEIQQMGNIYVMDVYDLQARHVRVAMDEAAKATLETAIKPYCKQSEYNLQVRIITKSADGYLIEAVYPSSSIINSVPPEDPEPNYIINLIPENDNNITFSGQGSDIYSYASNAVSGCARQYYKWVSSNSGDKWLAVDLGKNATITGWVVSHAGAGREDRSLNTKNFKFQTSFDGITWSDTDVIINNVDDNTDRTLASPVTARYVRLYITTPTQTADSTARIYQFQVYGYYNEESFDGINLAPAASDTVSASGYINDEWSVPSNAVGSSVRQYYKWVGNNSGDKWLSLDLGQPATLSRWVVEHAGAGGESAYLNTRDFKLQVSSNGSSWIDVDVVTGNTANTTDRNLGVPVTARYVRLYITVPTQTSDTHARIYQFAVYGY